MVAYRELFQVIIRTVIYVEVYISFYSRQLAYICVLPKFPFAFIFYLVHIIVGNPVGIIFKDWRAEIFSLNL